MKRTGGWLLGIAAGLGMLGGTAIGLFPYLFRENVTIVIVRPSVDPAPFADAIEDGTLLALEERDFRAGRFRVDVKVHRANLWHFNPGREALALESILDVNPGTAAIITAGPGSGMIYTGGVPGPNTVPVLSAADTVPRDPSAACSDAPPAYFRVLPDDRLQGAAAADWARRLSCARAYVLHEQFNTRSQLIASAFAKRAGELGLEIAGNDRIDPLKPAVSAVVLSELPDVVFFAGENPPYTVAHALFSRLRELGYTGRLMMAEASPHLSFLVVPGRAVEGTYLVSPFPPLPEKFRERFRERFNRRAGPHNYSGYLAAQAALNAIEQARSRKPGTVRHACAKLPHFDRNGDTADNAPAGYVLKNGEFEFVEFLE